jgi:hypothetical protein
MTFDELIFQPHQSGDGVWTAAFFPNGFGASVIRCKISHGWPELYEVAVTRGAGVGDCKLDMTTPIADDVIGHLTPEGVTQLLQQIEALPALPDEERVGHGVN